ncbi:MAG: M10 family metallopeptidase [Phormidesmis sp.]
MAYATGTPTLNITATDDNNTDALLNFRYWDGNSVTYGFTSSFENDYEEESGYPDSSTHASSFEALNDAQKQAVRQWVENYESVLDFDFIELTGSDARNATIRLATSDEPATAYAYYPASTVEAGDIWFNPSAYDSPDVGDYEYFTIGHEMAHALGLKHGHETGGVRNRKMDADRDAMEFSVMTYRSYIGQSTVGIYTNSYSSGYAQSLMMYDIKALQSQYGANFTHNAGNTTYRFSPSTGELFVDGVAQGQPGSNRIFRTLWDGNGTDTYDFSNYRSDLSIDLTPGGWSDLDVGGNDQRAYLGDSNYARAHVFNALQSEGDVRSLIENARGGSGNDLLTGNAVDNNLRGRSGNDTLYGGDGDDVINGDSDDDLLYGEAGNDLIKGGSGNDILMGGDGDDRMLGGAGDDAFWGGLGNHIMNGGGGEDSVNYEFWENGGTYDLSRQTANLADTYTDKIRNIENITTGDGADIVIGSAKDNRISTGKGNDDITGGGGDDYLVGGGGDDTLRGGAGNDYLNGANSASKGRGDQDILISGDRQDRDTFVLGEEGRVFYASRGDSDYAIVQDFAIDERQDLSDVIQLAGSAADYFLQTVSLGSTLGNIEGLGIYAADDLIGIVQNLSSSSLDLNNTSQFAYV